jgi:hypothetical protein
MHRESAHLRLREARTALGLTAAEFARKISYPNGISAYLDLEASPGDLFMTVSLAELSALGSELGIDPLVLLCDDREAIREPSALTFEQVAEAVASFRVAEGLSAEAVSEHLGWDVAGVLADPQALWDFNVDGLRDICGPVGLDWRRAVPNVPRLKLGAT